MVDDGKVRVDVPRSPLGDEYLLLLLGTHKVQGESGDQIVIRPPCAEPLDLFEEPFHLLADPGPPLIARLVGRRPHVDLDV